MYITEFKTNGLPVWCCKDAKPIKDTDGTVFTFLCEEHAKEVKEKK
jgi:predicted metal-binding transcription factor (methanogenesis marker protein 9)